MRATVGVPQSLVSGPVRLRAAAAQELRGRVGPAPGSKWSRGSRPRCAAKGFAEVANLRSSTLTVVVGVSPLAEDP